MKRLFCICICIVTLVTAKLFSQSHTTVPLDDPIYHLLDIAYIRGALPKASAVRPYTASTVAGQIDLLRSHGTLFSNDERAILDVMYGRYNTAPKPFRFDLGLDSNIRTDLLDSADYHLFSAYNFVFSGDITDKMSYRFFVAPTLDRVNSSAFAPFTFTKLWDFTHISTETGGHLSGDTDMLGVSQAYYPELAFTMFDDRVSLRWAKIRHNWGVGESSLQLSGSANPFDAIEGSFDIVPWLNFVFLSGSLANYREKNTSQSMISTKMVEFFLADWLYLSLYDSVIWGKRFELVYLNPFSVGVLAQGVVGDLDNVFTGGTLSFKLSPYFLAYFSIFMDDYRIADFKPFTNPFWKFALYGGIKAPVPYLPFTLFTFQYTKVEPWMYTHYPQTLPFLTEPTDISYVHSGENLGHYLPPNSDEFLFKLKSTPFHFLTALLQYQIIRHGDGDIALGQVEGDIEKSQRMDLPGFSEDGIPRKDFLNDGIYELIHIVTLGCDIAIDLGIVTLSFGPEYSFVSAKNFNNIEGNDTVKQILGFSLTGAFNVFTYGG